MRALISSTKCTKFLFCGMSSIPLNLSVANFPYPFKIYYATKLYLNIWSDNTLVWGTKICLKTYILRAYILSRVTKNVSYIKNQSLAFHWMIAYSWYTLMIRALHVSDTRYGVLLFILLLHKLIKRWYNLTSNVLDKNKIEQPCMLLYHWQEIIDIAPNIRKARGSMLSKYMPLTTPLKNIVFNCPCLPHFFMSSPILLFVLCFHKWVLVIWLWSPPLQTRRLLRKGERVVEIIYICYYNHAV